MATVLEAKPGIKAKTRAEAAYNLGISSRQLQTWEESGCPGRGEDGYDIRVLILWAKENVWRRRANAEDEGGGETEGDLRKQKLKEEIEAKRLANQQKRGQLVEKQAILAEQTRQNAIIRSRIESIPGEVASVVPPNVRGEVVASVEHKIKLTLKIMSEEE